MATCCDGDGEWGEVAWRGHYTDGSTFAMRGVIIGAIRDDRANTGVKKLSRAGSHSPTQAKSDQALDEASDAWGHR